MPELGLGFQAMDSPETTKLTTISTASDSPPIQDSPFSNFISNLSPIAQVRNTCIVRELSRLNSPPIVFKSPRTKQHNETNILKRSESLQLSRLETSESLNAGKESSDRLADAEKSGAVFESGLIAETETQKGCHVVESSETRPSSSSGCVDGFLADLEADCVNSAKSATPVPKQSDNAPKSDQTGSNGSKRTILQFDGQNGTWMDAERSLDAILFSSEQTENGIGLNTSLNEIEAEQHDDERLFGCQDINTSFPGGHAFTIQASQVSQVQVIENEHQSDPGCGSQPSAESFPEQTFGGHSKDVGGLSHKLVENTMLNGHKASENQRGVRRRCLQFEEVPLRSTGHSSASLNLVNNVNIMKESKSRHVESKESSESKMADLTQSGATLMRSRSSENISMASKPVGIGLHLNSVVVAASQRSPTTAQKQSTNQCIGVQGMGLRKLESTNSCSISLSVTPKDSALDETGKSNSQTADGFEDLDPSSPQKKRKKATGSDGADGCKRCSCKKTKCLKLYCDCFAAGVYCSGPCACQGCFNRPEYEDTVRETRKQIESRNPLAFAPKVVQRTSELPPNYGEAGNGSTPSSARHKRGCNCKRSMCLKKYCECYQANVGCSSGCRCEGCKNVYGRKEESAAMEYVISREVMVNKVCKKVIESTSDKPSEMVEIKRDQPCAESNNTNHLTPQTSSFQPSDPGKAAPKSRFLSERYLPSPDSDISVMSSYEKPTTFCPRPRDALSHGGMVSETCEGSKDRQADYNQGRLGSVSSICDSVSETLMPTLSTSSRTRDCISIAQNRKCPESHDPSLRSFTRHGSPLTPTTRVGGTKPRDGLDSGCELVDILEDNETPMRVSSPNKKRVSPPHSHIYKLGSGSSGTLKSGRKFILRSVPSFPPLTPFIESKGSNTSQSPNKLQHNSIKN